MKARSRLLRLFLDNGDALSSIIHRAPEVLSDDAPIAVERNGVGLPRRHADVVAVVLSEEVHHANSPGHERWLLNEVICPDPSIRGALWPIPAQHGPLE